MSRYKAPIATRYCCSLISLQHSSQQMLLVSLSSLFGINHGQHAHMCHNWVKRHLHDGVAFKLWLRVLQLEREREREREIILF